MATKTEEGGFQHIVFNDENPQQSLDTADDERPAALPHL
jgi:hypothetical protein